MSPLQELKLLELSLSKDGIVEDMLDGVLWKKERWERDRNGRKRVEPCLEAFRSAWERLEKVWLKGR